MGLFDKLKKDTNKQSSITPPSDNNLYIVEIPYETILKARRPEYGGIMMKAEILKRKRTSVNTNLYKQNRGTCRMDSL